MLGQFSKPSGSYMGSNALSGKDFYASRGIAGQIPVDYTQHGGGFAALSPQAQTPQGLLDYYTQTQERAGAQPGTIGYNAGNRGGIDAPGFFTLNNYLHGTFFKKGNPIPGTNIRNSGQLYSELFGSPNINDEDYLKLTPEALTQALGPQAEQVMRNARDWEVRDISRANQKGFSTGGLLGALAVGGILAPAVIAGSGGIGALKGLNPLTKVQSTIDKAGNFLSDPIGSVKGAFSGSVPTTATANPLGINASQLYNPAALGGKVSSGVTALPGGGFVNPGALGIQANTLAAGVPNLANPVWSAPKWTGTQSLPGGGFVNPSAMNVGPTDLYNPVSLGGTKPGLLDRAKDFLGDQLDPMDALDFIAGGEQGQPQGGSDTGFGGDGVGAGSMPLSLLPQPEAQRSQQLDPVIDAIMNSSAEEGMAGQMPQYEAQKLQPGPDVRLSGYQTQPFASAVQRPRNALAA